MSALFSSPWFVGIATSIFAGFLLWLIIGDRKIFSHRFSSTQYIKILPPSLGGNDRLNLDNVATLQLHAPNSNNKVTLLLNSVPIIELPSRDIRGGKIEGFKLVSHTGAEVYTFSTDKSIQKIKVRGRSFVVNLRKISLLDIKDVSGAIQYEFGITEE